MFVPLAWFEDLHRAGTSLAFPAGRRTVGPEPRLADAVNIEFE